MEEANADILGLDQKLQYSFREIILPFCKKLEFCNNTFLAKRYWLLGKDHSIVVDPNHSFGQPTISGTNITVFAILKLLKAGESKKFVSKVFEIKTNDVEDVLSFSQRIAA